MSNLFVLNRPMYLHKIQFIRCGKAITLVCASVPRINGSSIANILSMAKSYYDSERTFILQLCKSMPFISEIRIICFDIRAFHEVAVKRVERNGADIVAELIKKNTPKCLCIANKWEMCNIVVVVFLSILLSSFGQQNSTQALDDVLPKCTHT